MDDFDYSVHISEKDWESFFLECEECNLLPPELAGMEDSGMSDMDEIASRRAQTNMESRVPVSEFQTIEREESPVDLYLSRYGLSSPMQVLSGSEEDLHMEAVNVFFERFKSVSASEESSMQKRCSDVGSEMTGRLEDSVKVKSAKETAVFVQSRPKRDQVIQRKESMQKDESSAFTLSTKPISNEFRIVTHAPTHPDPELVNREEKSSWDVIKEVQCDPCRGFRLKSSTGKIPCYTLVNGKTLTSSERNANSQLVTVSDSDSKELLESQGQSSSITPRRKRRKKKRIEPMEADHGHEVQFQAKQSESDNDLFVRRKEMDRQMCPSSDCTSGTHSLIASAPHMLSPPAKIDSILEKFLLHPQCPIGNVVEPTVIYPNSSACQETLESPCTINAAQNKRTPEFMHEKRDLTGEPSTGQFARTVTSGETGVPGERTGPLMPKSNDTTSAPTNGDNVGIHLQLNSNWPSDDTAALLAPKALPASITTGNEVEIVSQTTRKTGNAENLLSLISKDVKMDFTSSVLHQTGNSQVNCTNLPSTGHLPSDPTFCSQTSYNLHAQSQEKFKEIMPLPEFQWDRSDAVCQRKTSASANISCVAFTEKAQEMPPFEIYNNAEKKPNLTCVANKNTHDFLDKETLSETFNSKLVTQSGPVNTGEAQVSFQINVHNTQMQATQCPSGGTKPEAKKKESEQALISNKSVNGKLPSPQLSEDWTEEISLNIGLNDTSLPECKKIIQLKEVDILPPIPEDRNKGLSLKGQSSICQPLIQIINLESELKENQTFNITTTGKENNFEVFQVAPPNCSSKDHELSSNAVMQSVASTISESVEGAKNLETKNGRLSRHTPSEDWTEGITSSSSIKIEGPAYSNPKSMDGPENTLSNIITTSEEEKGKVQIVLPNLPTENQELPDNCQKIVEILSSADKNEGLSAREQCKTFQPIIQITGSESQLGGDSKSEYISSRHVGNSSDEEKREMLYPLKDDDATPTPRSMDGAKQPSSNIFTTGDEEGKVHNMPPQVPAKDLEYLPSAVLQTMTFEIPQSMDKAEQQSFDITTGEEEKGKVHSIPPQVSPKDNGHSPSAVFQSTASPIPQSMDGAEQPSSNITTGEKEKGKVHCIPPQVPPKDLEYSPNAVLQSMASPVPQLIDGAEQVSYNIITTGDEKGKVHCTPSQVPPKDNEHSPSAVLQTMASLITRSIDEAKHTSSIITTDDEEKGKLHCKPPLFPPKDLEYIPSAILQPLQHPSSKIITAGDEEEGILHFKPPQFPTKDLEYSPTAVLQSMASPVPQSLDGTQQPSSNIITNGIEEERNVHNIPPQVPAKDLEYLSSAVLQIITFEIPQSMDKAEQQSFDITTGEEEKGKVHSIPPQVSPKDNKHSPSAVFQSMASPIPQSMDGAEQPSSNIITTAVEEEGNGHNIPPQDPPKDIEYLSSAVLQSMASPTHQSMDGAEKISSNITTGVEEEGNVHNTPPQGPHKDPEYLPSAVLQSIALQVPQSVDEAEQPSSNIIIAGEEENEKVHCIPPQVPPKDNEHSPSAVLQSMASQIPQSMDGAEQPTSNITGDEEKDKVHNIPSPFPPKVLEYSPTAVLQSIAFSIPQSWGEAEQPTFNTTTTDGEEEGKVHNIPPQVPAKDLEYLPSAVLQTMTFEIPQSMDKAEQQSFDITTGEEEKGKVHSIAPQVSPKDNGHSPSAVFQSMASPIPQSMDGAEQLSSNIFTTAVEEEGNVHNIPPRVPRKDLEHLQSAVLQSMASQIPQSIDGAEQPSSDITTGEKEKGKVHYIPPPQVPPKDLEYSPNAVLQSMASPVPQLIDGAEQVSSNIITTGDEKVHCTPPQVPRKDNELSPNKIMEGMSFTFPESTDGAKKLETVDAVSQSPSPVYAISSFWNEMEKLTINDILRLRLVGQAQHPGVLLQSEDSGIADISDAADSGYFTHLDDSKPDRSSGDMSYISDFEEELAQLQTQEAGKLDEESRESANSGDMMWESDPDPSGTGTGMEDVFMLSSETALLPPLYSDNAQQCFRKMCKNISVQNLQTLETQPLRKMLRNASLLSIHSVHSTQSIKTEVEDDYVDPFDRVDASSPVCSSDDDEEVVSTGITFSEIIQYLFGGDEPDRCVSAVDNVTSYLDETGTSVPETYDHFFSDFEASSLFYPVAEETSSSKDELVPIFSCSRSGNRNLQFPEVYDYFFPDDSPITSDEDEEHDHTVIQVVTRYDTPEQHCPKTDDGWSFLKNNPLSFRRVRRAGFTAPPEKSNSLALTPVKNNKRTFWGGIQPINALGADEKPFPDPLLLSLENRIFRQLADQPNIRNEMQTAVADPRVDAALMPLKQADMCLVCIAFASWVLKSANPQGADMWKAALLANISALSAIRYLRRYMRDEATRKTPLHQIEPA